MDYDIEIKPTKLVKGHGLERLLANTNCKALGLNLVMDHSLYNESKHE